VKRRILRLARERRRTIGDEMLYEGSQPDPDQDYQEPLTTLIKTNNHIERSLEEFSRRIVAFRSLPTQIASRG
jgi:hypothetical protein